MRHLIILAALAVTFGAVWVNWPATVHRVQPQDDIAGMFPATPPPLDWSVQALSTMTTGSNNIVFGYRALQNTTATDEEITVLGCPLTDPCQSEEAK
jgi:hypothetical protein